MDYPFKCELCGIDIVSSEDLHGYGNCVEITDEMWAQWEKEGIKMPDCSICGRPSPDGEICHACKALKAQGYNIETEEISGVKTFKDWASVHFYSGYRTANNELLKQAMTK